MVRAASIEAYRNSNEFGINSQREIAVILCLKANPRITRQEISERTGLPINIVSGRVSDLKDKGVLVEHPRELTKYSRVKIGTLSVSELCR
jgi:DNA-binding MarR family transcriptional regulator